MAKKSRGTVQAEAGQGRGHYDMAKWCNGMARQGQGPRGKQTQRCGLAIAWKLLNLISFSKNNLQ